MNALEKHKKAYRFGLTAERVASVYLRSKGYRVRAARYRNNGGEIDIVATRGRTLVVVEVKARKTLLQCADTITPHKQQKIIRATEGLLGGHVKIAGLDDLHTRSIRFDIIWIAPWRWPRHITDAWRV